MSVKASFCTKIVMLPVDHHGDYRISHIVYLLGENVAKYKNMSYGCDLLKSKIQHCRQVFIAFFNVKVTHLPLDHDGDYRMRQSYCFHVE